MNAVLDVIRDAKDGARLETPISVPYLPCTQ